MTSTLIVLMLAALTVAVIVLARRRGPTRPARDEPDTAWTDPIGPTVDRERERADDGTR